MTQQPTAYPLAWPAGYRRLAHSERTRSKFRRKVHSSGSSYCRKETITIADGVSRVMLSIKKFTRTGHNWRADPDQVVISTNLRTRNDGLPASGQKEPEDPGVAVYFVLDGRHLVICADKYTKVADNLAAVAATIEALRDIERHGATEVERAFTGFAALPDTGHVSARTCWDVLGIQRTTDAAAITQAYRARAMLAHPDRGGSTEAMAALNDARDQALRDIQKS